MNYRKSDTENEECVSREKEIGKIPRDIVEKMMTDSSSVTDEELLKIVLSYMRPSSVLCEEVSEKENVLCGSVMYSTIALTKETEETESFFKALERISELSDEETIPEVLWGDYDSAGIFFQNHIGKDASEILCVVFLDEKGKLIKTKKFSMGKTDSVSVGTELIIKSAERCKARKVLIAHNHPSGYLGFSKEDWLSTKKLLSVLSAMKISLIEHYAVSCEGYVGILARFDQENSPIRKG